MRKAAAITLATTLLTILALQFSGCEKYVLPQLEISSDTLVFSAAGNTLPLTVTTNVITTIYPESSDTWIYVEPDWIDETTTVSIRVKENTGTSRRTATVPVKSEIIQRDLVIIQEGAASDD